MIFIVKDFLKKSNFQAVAFFIKLLAE